jgi:isochorismate synthase
MDFLVLYNPFLKKTIYYTLTKVYSNNCSIQLTNYKKDTTYFGYENNDFDIDEATLKFNPKELKETTKSEYIGYLNAIFKSFEAQGLKKVVASRTKFEKKPKNFNPKIAFDSLKENFPYTFVFWLYINNEIQMMGASPEIVGIFENNKFTTYSLAGTISKKDDFSDKEYVEQEIVTDSIKNTLAKYQSNIVVTPKEHFQFGNIKHILNQIEIKVDSKEFKNIIEEIHPSAALSGFPKNEAIHFINQNEPQSRSFYTGLCHQIIDNENQYAFAFLRCFEIFEKELLFYAGGGIINDSDIETEWFETERKINSIKSIVM